MEIAVILTLWSSAFGNGDLIPMMYTADGEDISPPLEWECDSEAESYAIICEDFDAPAGAWVHWVVYNIPGEKRILEEGIPAREELTDGTLQGENSWGNIGYGGPAPPSGKHTYYFTIYALEGRINLAPGATAMEIREAMEGQILGETELTGEYTRE